MPHYLNFAAVTVSGETEPALPGPRDVRIVAASATPKIVAINAGNAGDGTVIAIQNVAGVAVELVHSSNAASAAARKLLMNGLGGNWTLPHGKTVRAFLVNPAIQGFPDAARGWYVDNRGQEVLGRGKATITTSAPENSGALALIPEMTIAVTTVGGPLVINGWVVLDVQDGDAGTIQLYVGGDAIDAPVSVALAGGQGVGDPSPSTEFPVHLTARVDGLSAGSHTVEAKWAASAGALRAVTTRRGLRAEEMYP